MTFLPSRALVTGASSGIGLAFARRLAARDCDLVLVARRGERLEALADELTAAHGVRCQVIAFDLSVEHPGHRLLEQVGGEVDLVVNNAGFAVQGPFVEGEPGELVRVIAVDVRAVVDICRAFLPGMVERGGGSILNVSSTTAFQPVPSLAVYAAAKAFVVSFSQALWEETRRHGVTVLSLAPGPTRTEFFDVIGDEASVFGRFQTPDQVAAAGLRALDRRRTPPSVVSGAGNAVVARLVRVVPARVLTPVLAGMLRRAKASS
ncbi:SDR family NAD(P)-dependent oxidoreductase [Spongisporangium articulatum]|uniref:SDR family NAD(P)-dependent oxidoreductase n=1 Tax=Spongisporangium articulatum TaxID=3362603 RepID=A0ABW8AKC8_9ACTN